MKKIFNLLLFLAICMPALAQQTQTRALSGFTSLSIGIPADVRLTKGPFKVVLEGEDLEEIETTITGGKLKIGRENGNFSFFGNDADDLVIYITMPELDGVSMSGSGSLTSTDQFSSKNMRLSVSGSGSIKVNVVADEVDASVSGSGNLETAGTAKHLNARISGSGRVKAAELHADEVDIRISGSGDGYVHAEQRLDAHVSGSGNVRYTGNPNNISVKTSGSGKISKRG